MKGVSQIIGVMLIGIVVLGIAFSFAFFGSKTGEVQSEIEERQASSHRAGEISFVILNVTFDRSDLTKAPNVTILNNGKVEIDLDELTVYLNNSKHRLERYPGTPRYLQPGETAVLMIKQ